jgi:hypothetical protein
MQNEGCSPCQRFVPLRFERKNDAQNAGRWVRSPSAGISASKPAGRCRPQTYIEQMFIMHLVL